MSCNLNNLGDNQNLLLTQISGCADEMSKIPDIAGKSFEEILNNAAQYGLSDSFVNRLQQCVDAGMGSFRVKAYANNDSGLKALAFTDDFGNTGFSYYGTDSEGDELAKDMHDNIKEVLISGDSDQCREALQFFDDNKGDSNYLFGHSHGGAICQYIFLEREDEINGCFLFNPALLKVDDKDRERLKNPKIKVIITEGDKVSKTWGTDSPESRFGPGNVKRVRSIGAMNALVGCHTYENVMLDENGNTIDATNNIHIDSGLMWDYADRLRDLNGIIWEIDWTMKRVCVELGFESIVDFITCTKSTKAQELFELFQAERSNHISLALLRSAGYLDSVANKFIECEQRIESY